MKKIILLFVFFIAAQGFAQTNGISYQAIIMNPKGEQLPGVNNANSPVVNKDICMVFKFIDEFSNIEYQETVQTKTDGFGMVNLVIGKGTQTAGYAASFQSIVWNSSKKSLIVGINTNGNCSTYTEISNQEFSYAPLAFSAISAENVTGVVAIENGGTNATTVLGAKTNLGLENVDNTRDLNKPVSTATQTALNTKAPLASPTFTGTVSGITKAMVGLANVDNTSDANKPVSVATQTALDLKENTANKSTNVTVDGTSDVKYPTVKAVKNYVDAGSSSATSALATEITRATNAEGVLAANLTTETTNRISAVATLTTNLASEVTNRTAANLLKEDVANKSTNVTTDGTSDAKYPSVKSVKTYVDAATASSSTALTNEVNRATAAENTIATNLTTETTARTAADVTLTTDLATEVTNRTAADLLKEDVANKSTDLTTDGASDTKYPSVKSVKIYVDASATSASTALTTEINRATAAENTIASNLTTEITARTSADGALTTDLATEVTNRIAADNTLTTNLGTETLARTSADGILQTNINAVQADVDANEAAANTVLNLKAPLASPTFTGTVSGVTKTMVGLGNVDNTTDLLKPVSTATQTALDLKVDKVSGERLINATEITKLSNQSGINTGDQDLSSYATNTALALKAPLASPTFTGTPLAPTADSGTSNTQIATTKFVSDAISTLSVPYTGATGPVDLGAYDLKINGTSFGTNGQPGNIGIGINAGSNTQGSNTVAIGNETGMNTQGSNAVAIGAYTAGVTQGSNAVAVGYQAAYTNQGSSAVAIGNETASTNQGANAIAIGNSTAYNNQGSYALAVGASAGNANQGSYAVAMGTNSGNNTQGSYAIAVGNETGYENQGVNAVALGNLAGKTNQGSTAIAIGNYAGRDNQGENAIAIGSNAGKNNQNSNSIILNATGNDLDTATSGFFVDPIRNVSSSTALFYDVTTKEITYGSLPSVSLTSGVTGILPVSNGGSGVNTATGTGSLVLSASPTFTGTVSGITKAMVGLNNVDNTTDLLKPVSTATQTALDLKVDKVTGKGLSTEDYTTTEKTKLAAITGTNTGDQDISGIAINASKIGDLSNLTTTTKSNLVAAINETNGAINTNTTNTGNLSSLTTTAKSNLVAAINETNSAINTNTTNTGSLSSLTTTAKSNLVAAINETNAAINTNTTIAGDLSSLTTTAKSNLVAAVNEIQSGLDIKANIDSPIFTGTVSGITKAMVGLENVDNISDVDKPISTATQTALNLKANLASPTLTGIPLAPTATAGTNTTQIATTAFVTNAVADATTGSFVDLTTSQTIAGTKTFSSDLTINATKFGRGAGSDSSSRNIAIGNSSLSSNSTGSWNTAIGTYALQKNTGASANTAIGNEAISESAPGSNNTGVGSRALMYTSGAGNTSVGTNALINSAAGNNNTAIGLNAFSTNTTGSNNTAIGASTVVSSTGLTNATAIGYGATVANDNTIQLGNTAVTDVKTSGKLTTGAITLPNTDGTSGQVLSTNGSGAVSWITPSGASSANFVDLTTNQTIAGSKTFNSNLLVNGITVGTYTSMDGQAYSNTLLGRNVVIGDVDESTVIGFNASALGYQSIALGAGAHSDQTQGISIGYHSSIGSGYGFAIGSYSQSNAMHSVALGPFSQTSGNYSVALGYQANASAENSIAIGKGASATISNTIQLGNTAITDVKTSGFITASGYKIPSGTASQFLMADGSVSTGGSGTSITEDADEFTATAAQISFTLTHTPSANSKVKMFINGIRISNTAYSVSGATLTYIPTNNGSYALSVGDRIQFDYFH